MTFIAADAALSEIALPDPADAQLHRELAVALQQNALTLQWQPIVDVRSLRRLGFEALIRWYPPGRPPVSPERFVGVAERTPLIATLDAWVLRRACQEAAAWPVAAWFSVNVSSQSFITEGYPERVERVLRATGVPPYRLELEITERVLLDDIALFQHNQARLQRLGARVTLDDFGAGYSSLGVLSSVSFDKIKLDRSFLTHVGDGSDRSGRAEKLIRAMLSLGRDLDAATCVEGIETPAQLRFLQDIDCNQGQGYLISRPHTLEPQDFDATAMPFIG